MNTLSLLKFRGWAALALFVIGSFAAQAEWAEGDKVPALADYPLSGELPDLQGKVTYIDFWASWCAPCKKSFPSMETLYQKYKDAGFQVIAVSVDGSEKAMKSFTDRAQPSFAVVHDAQQALVRDTGLEVMPTSYLVDQAGTIRSVHLGWDTSESERELEKEIKALLEGGAK